MLSLSRIISREGVADQASASHLKWYGGRTIGTGTTWSITMSEKLFHHVSKEILEKASEMQGISTL